MERAAIVRQYSPNHGTSLTALSESHVTTSRPRRRLDHRQFSAMYAEQDG